jgi:oligosaccharide repeat unit polymerase
MVRPFSGRYVTFLASLSLVGAVLCFFALTGGSQFDGVLYTPLAIAVLISLLSITLIVQSARAAGTIVDGRALAWASFTLAYPLSSVAHLILRDSGPRGFYDLLRSRGAPLLDDVYVSLLLIVVAMIGLWLGLGWQRRSHAESRHSLVRVDVDLLVPYGGLLTAVGLVGTLVLATSQGSLMEGLMTIDRGRFIGGGQAKFVFMSGWLSWGAVFLLAPALSRRRFASDWSFFLVIAGVSVVLILNLYWTGGRAFAAAMLLPMLFLIRKVVPDRLTVAVVCVALLVVGYAVIATVARASSQVVLNESDLVLDVFDWQMGRFSMVGMSVEFVRTNGFLLGSTLLHGFVNALNAPLVLLQASPPFEAPAGYTSVIGGYLTGDATVNAIVPGTIAELYANLGVAGVAIGYFLLGFLIRTLVRVMHRTSSASSLGLSGYVVVLLCLTCIPGTATGWMYYLVTTGFPALLFWLIEHVGPARNERSDLWHAVR